MALKRFDIEQIYIYSKKLFYSIFINFEWIAHENKIKPELIEYREFVSLHSNSQWSTYMKLTYTYIAYLNVCETIKMVRFMNRNSNIYLGEFDEITRNLSIFDSFYFTSKLFNPLFILLTMILISILFERKENICLLILGNR